MCFWYYLYYHFIIAVLKQQFSLRYALKPIIKYMIRQGLWQSNQKVSQTSRDLNHKSSSMKEATKCECYVAIISIIHSQMK